jgi:hypothetical protein
MFSEPVIECLAVGVRIRWASLQLNNGETISSVEEKYPG